METYNGKGEGGWTLCIERTVMRGVATVLLCYVLIIAVCLVMTIDLLELENRRALYGVRAEGFT
jgi:hypothetical protein